MSTSRQDALRFRDFDSTTAALSCDLRAEYPELELDDIRQALGFAASNLGDQRAINLEQLRTDICAGTKSGSAGELDIAAIKRKGRGRLVKTTQR